MGLVNFMLGEVVYMKYLFCYGYMHPDELESNTVNGTDFESSNGAWIIAKDKDTAIRHGIAYAKKQVNMPYLSSGMKDMDYWSENNFANWIEVNPEKLWDVNELNKLETIVVE